MREASAVLMSDGLNRDRTRFATAEMWRALSALWQTGLPSLLGHDAHRLIGWALPTFVSIVPGLTRLHGAIYLSESDSDQSLLESKYLTSLSERVTAETREHISELRKLLASSLSGDEKAHSCAATALVGQGLALRTAPEIFENVDKDGLVNLRALTPIYPGVYRVGEFALFAHQYLRRSLSRLNTLRLELLTDLQNLTSTSDVNVRLRLDPDMVGLAKTVKKAMEMDYWYGPPFKDDLTSITPGVTRYEASEFERSFAGISRTEFWWQSRDQQHILEAEELRDKPSFGVAGTQYGCRYVHSIVDEETGRVVHLDGAIREYSEEALVQRLDYSIADTGRNTKYTKLWRVDGQIPISSWKRVIYDYYRDNSLIDEYLDSSIPKRETQQSSELPIQAVVPSATDRVRDLVPHSMIDDVGMAIILSLWPHPQFATTAREVEALECLVFEDQSIPTIDADTLELAKTLRQLGRHLSIPPAAARLAFDDQYLTFPLIRHDSRESARATFEAIAELVTSWIDANQGARIFTFSLSVPFQDAELRCAVIARADHFSGNVASFREFLACETCEDIADWTEKASRALGTAKTMVETERLDRLITSAATFRIKRSQIDRQYVNVHMGSDRIECSMKLPHEDSALVEAVEKGALQPAAAWLLKASECSRCGVDYSRCLCSKYLDANVSQRVTEAEIAYLFWTDRRA